MHNNWKDRSSTDCRREKKFDDDEYGRNFPNFPAMMELLANGATVGLVHISSERGITSEQAQ